MKRTVALIMLFAFVFAFTGCSKNPSDAKPLETQPTVATEPPTEPPTEEPTQSPEELELFSNMSGTYVFSSGAGAWGTTLNVFDDGTFSGNYHDTDMGAGGANYDCTFSTCTFIGAFKNVEKVNDYTFSVEVDYLNYLNEAETEEIKDGYRYVYTEAYGVSGTDTFYIYTPDAKISDLPDEYKSWGYNMIDAPKNQKLGFYGIYNITEKLGFVSND